MAGKDSYDYGGLEPVSHNQDQYPFVGDAYIGELPGHVYDPYQNVYLPDPESQDEYYEETGIGPEKPKDPKLSDTLLPIGAAGLAYAGGQVIAEQAPGLFSGSSTATTPSVTGATGAASSGVSGSASTGSTGLIGGSSGFSGTGSLGSSGAGFQGVQASGGVQAGSAGGSFLGPSTGQVGLNSLSTLGPAAGVAAYYGPSAYQHGSAIIQGDGTEDDWLKAGLLSNPVTAWAVPLADKFGIGIGHGKNYYHGKNREKILDVLSKGTGSLSFGSGENPYTVTAEGFRKDPTTYNYDQSSASHDTDIGAAQALTYLTTGAKPGDVAFEQTAGMFANAHKSGVSTQDLYSTLGLDYNTAYQKIANDPNLKPEYRDAFLNGLDQSFGTNAFATGAPSAVAAPKAPQAPSVPMPKDPGNGTGVTSQGVGLLTPPRVPQRSVIGTTPPPGSGQGLIGPKDNNVAAPRPGFGVRQSPGIYTDPRTGQTYLSKNGLLPSRR